jgi:hypothetical protein
MSISTGSFGIYFTKIMLILVISSEAINISLSVRIPEDVADTIDALRSSVSRSNVLAVF